MSTRLVIYLSAAEHQVYRWTGSDLELQQRFGADEQGLEQFRAFMKARRGAIVYVLADLAGEDFHEDQIPFVRGSDRQSVIERRLAQRYRDTRLSAAISLGYTAGERRHERLLLASFTNTQQFAEWLDALAESGARLSGVYSVPLVAPALAARLGARGGHCFVVTANASGLRQCFVEQGRLRFARLERIGEDLSPQALAVFVRSETLRLTQYLWTLRALPRDGAPVQVIVVAPSGQRAQFEEALVSDATLSFHTLDMSEAARKIGLKAAPAGLTGERLYMHLVAKRPPAEQFARLEDRRSFVLWRWQRAVVAAGAFGFAACMAFAGLKWIDVMQLRDQIATQRNEAGAATREYERITSTFPVTHTSSDNLKAAVTEFRNIADRTATPEPAFGHLSRVLEQFPQIDLEALTWSMERAARPKPVPGQPAAPPPPGDGPVMAQVLEIVGRVQATQRSDYRGITEQVQRFAVALTTDRAYQIARTQLPFDVTPEATLSGDIGETAERQEAPRFTIAISRVVK